MTHLEMSIINITLFQIVFSISVLVRILRVTDGKVGLPSRFASVIRSVHKSNHEDFKKTSYINGMFVTIFKTQTKSVLKEYLLLNAGIIFFPTNWNLILCGNELCVPKKCVFINCQYLYIII